MSVVICAGALLLGTLVSSIAQVFLKKASQKEYKSVIQEYLNPVVILSYAVFFGATLLGVYAYKGIPLSMGPVLEATGYIYIMIFGVKIFHESFNRWKALAIGMILAGIIVYSFLG
ncbi:MAG: EamA family transporter [Lachnospiraceae bacterium]|nr:EamA family transporter [Lachnospiraceae bacterium]MBR3734546.1 EamA family transporter [Lachnospiraceae bacterium]